MENMQDILVDLAAECYADPVKFAELAFDWGNGDLEGFDGLDKWQADYLRKLGADIVDAEANDKPVRKATASGHGIGKSALVSIIILWYMTTRPRARIRVTANTEKQLLGTTWPELALWHKRSIFSEWFTWEATRFSKVGDRENWFAEAVSWNENNPDAFAGLHGRFVLLIMDEASGVADSIWETAMGVITGAGNTHLAFGNPIRPSGGFYDCFFHPKKSKRWDTQHINALETKLGNSQSNREIFEDYGAEHDVTRRRVLGQFPRQAASQFISTADVEDAMKRRLERSDYENYPVYMGVDVARFGDDRSCIVLRQGPKVLDIQTFEGIDTVQLAKIATGILRSRRDIQMAFVDEVGVGAGVIDMMRRFDDRAMGVNVGRRPSNMKLYKNQRVELWDKMRQDIPKMDLPENDSLKRELTTIEYDFTDQGQMRLERKIDMKRRGLESPDCFVAGTQISTISGPKNIEHIKAGDLVLTPFGYSRVVKSHCTEAKELATVDFSNGSRLVGKPKHDIFTMDEGWVPMGKLSCYNAIESDSLGRLIQWNLSKWWNTAENDIGFKQAVGTIKMGTKPRRKDYCTAKSGRSTTALYRAATASTTLITIGQITLSKILSVFLHQSTQGRTRLSECKTQNIAQRLWNRLSARRKKQKNGTPLKRGDSGTPNTVKIRGKRESQCSLLAKNAETSTKLFSRLGRGFAQALALSALLTVGILTTSAFAVIAAIRSLPIGTARPSIAPVSVQLNRSTEKTYNLTLEQDNAYYANGILVANCADALALTYARPDGAEFEMFENDDYEDYAVGAGRNRITGY